MNYTEFLMKKTKRELPTGIELNEEYIEIAKQRVKNEAGHVQVTMFDREEEQWIR